MEGRLKIEKAGKVQTLELGRINKKDFELIKKRYEHLGFEIKEER